jgi:hypothetical protein
MTWCDGDDPAPPAACPGADRAATLAVTAALARRQVLLQRRHREALATTRSGGHRAQLELARQRVRRIRRKPDNPMPDVMTFVAMSEWRRSRKLVFWDVRDCAPGPQGRPNRPSSSIPPGVGRRRRPIDGQ